MLIEKIEQLKEWLTNSLSPICEADPGALAKYVVALVKKDKPLTELKDSCVDQLDVFLQSKTKPFVETLFEVLENKSYITKEEPVPDPADENSQENTVKTEQPTETLPDTATSTSDQNLVTSTSKTEVKKEEIKEENVSQDVPRRRSPSPRFRGRGDDRRRRFEERRPYDRNYPRRRSVSPRYRGRRSRSPYRRRSPFRPLQRSRSPRFRGRERGRSRSKSWTKSRSWSRSPKRSYSRSPKRSWSRSRSRERFRSPGGRITRSSKSRSPRREVRPRSGGRSPIRKSPSPRFRSRSPRKQSQGRSKSPVQKSKSVSPGARSRSLSRSRSGSPARKVRRQDSDSRGPTPTLENGLADSTNVTPSESSISVVSTGVGRYEETHGRLRCRDFDEKGFCVRGDMCPYDHGADPVIVENVPAYPPGPHGGPPPHLGHPPPGMGPGGPINVSVPPPGFFPPVGLRPPLRDLPQEPYNPEAPALTRPGGPPYWPGGPPDGLPPPPFMHRPPPLRPPNHIPVKSRLGNRDLVTLTIKNDFKAGEDDEEDDDVPSSSTRTVIAPKEDHMPTTVSQPPPPGVSIPETSPQQRQVAGPTKPGFSQQRFHPYKQGEHGPRKPFDFNRVGGYRKPDQSNCTLEVRKVPADLNNIAKINEHFGKFGTLTNIQVKFEGDPEAALVTFSTNQEAYNCYKSSEPVFNNRFVKLFWHQKNKTDTAGNQEQSPTSTTTQASQASRVDSSQSLQSRLGPIPPLSKLSLNNIKKPVPSSTTTTEEPAVVPAQPERNVVYTTSMGTVSKTVYNPAALKPKPSPSLTSPTAVKAADFVTRMEKVKQQEKVKQEMAQKKLEIQKQKQQLLEKQIEQQKKLIDSLDKNKDLKEENKKAIMETLKTLTTSIDKLKTELGTRHVVLKQSDSAAPMKSPEQAKKEILDVELELMTKSTSGEDTAELKKKLTDLTAIANSMGLLGTGRGRGRGAARGRGLTTWVAAGITPQQPPVIGRGRGRGMTKTQVMATRTLDRRPKIVEVSGFEAEEKDEMHVHLKGLNGVEKVEFPDSGTPKAIVEFKTRKNAEQGIIHGGKFKTKFLKMVWHIPKPDLSRSSSTTSVDTDDHEEIDEEALLAGAEDEDEEEDNRAWRR